MNRLHNSSEKIEGSTDRVFGLVMTGFFALVALSPLLRGGSVRVWALLLSGMFLAAALIYPRSLTLLNKWWMRFGLLLSKIVSPIAMGIVFFGVMTPFGLVMRWLGKSSIPMHFDRDAKTYWITRQPSGPDPQGMKHPF